MSEDLFDRVAENLERERLRHERDGRLVVPSELWAPLAVAAYDELRLGAFCTEPAGGHRVRWRREHDAQRSAARRGRRIERAVLLGDPSRRADRDVRELVDLDARAGVRTRLIDAVNALPALDPPGGSLRFAILDGQVVCTSDGAAWHVSRNRDDLELATAAANALRSTRDPALDPGAGTQQLVVGEPLATSAPLARLLAPVLCSPVGSGIAECASYHGLVQYMRLLDLVSSPQRHGVFYRTTLASLARSGQRRVLIAGAADYSMLAHVLAAYEDADEAADVTVLDRCPTPLAMCRWYAAANSVPIRTEVSNVLDLDCAEPFDVICTDALLTLLSAQEKPLALRRLAGALRPGGRLVTTVRIAPDAPERFDEERVAAFSERVREEAARRRGLLDVGPDVLAREARRYARGLVVHPTRSREQLAELIERAGLRLEQLLTLRLAGKTTAAQAGPGAHQSATYAHIVAARD